MRVVILSLFFISSLLGQKTLCYKKNLSGSSVNENIQLSGKDCQGKLTVKDMRKLGWSLDDIKITDSGDGYNHLYIFAKETVFEPVVQNKIEPRIQKYDLTTKKSTLQDTTASEATVNIGNLVVGQSGIVVHNVDSNSIIVAQASVTSSNSQTSKISFSEKKILVQDAIPTTKLTPQNGDEFILNHLYGTSLLIVPNKEAKNSVKELYTKQNFLNEDFFASYLKLTNSPSPSRDDISDFCQAQQIGTIFMVIESSLYVVDALSFKIIDTVELNLEDTSTNVPFLTKVTEIEKPFWSFGSGQISNYTSYYSTLLGI